MFSINHRKHNKNKMKYYETHFDDYITSIEKYNLHPELNKTIQLFPNKIQQFENLIVFGPAGVGKYSQVLKIIKKYSPSELKYDKKITAQTEKQQYNYRMSDIHYEIDMSLLGCNSKILWHEIFFQIVDIISVKPEKSGIILCKNMHLIHAELLEIFYSYMQQYNHTQANIRIKFIIMTEHISFLPTPIINACHIINIGRPTQDRYIQLSINNALSKEHMPRQEPNNNQNSNQAITLIKNIDLTGITNIKELRSFTKIETVDKIPTDLFNIICDNIINEILSPKTLSFTSFRDKLYDILTYNLDLTECVWYILSYFIENRNLKTADITEILIKSYPSLKYFNNNYRPIYHLESIMFTIINKIHNYHE
jgi:hypothetical protein